MKKFIVFIPLGLLFIYFTLPYFNKPEQAAQKINDLSSTIEENETRPTSAIHFEESSVDDTEQQMGPIKPQGISQAQIVTKEVETLKASVAKLQTELTTLNEQQNTITVEGSDFKTDLEINYLNKLMNIRDRIENQKMSESHPQIKTHGLKAVNAMIDMMTAYINDPNDPVYKTLGETASRHIQKAFADVDLTNTIEIVKYLSQAGDDQVTIGLKLRDAQTIATKFLTNYGYDDTPKGEAYKKNKLQHVATQNVIELKQAEFDQLSLELSGLYQELEEVTQ